MADKELQIMISGDTSRLQESTRRGGEELRAFARDAAMSSKAIEDSLRPTAQLAAKQRELSKALEAGQIDAKQYRAEMAKLTAEHKQFGRERESLKKSTSPFGKEARENIGSYIASLGVASAAVGILQTGLEQLASDAEKGLSSVRRNRSGDIRLSQVATSKDDLAKLRGQADDAAVTFGLQRDEARSLMFDARSLGFDSDRDFTRAARATQAADVGTISDLAGKFRGVFKGRQELTVDQAISSAFAAAQFSAFDAGQLAKQARMASETSGLQGTSAEETMAATAVLGSKMGESTGARIKTFQSQLTKSEATAGKGIAGAMDVLMGMDDAGRKEILGDNQEANAVYSELKALIQEFRKTQASIMSDMRGGGLALQRRIEIAEGDRTLMAQRFNTASEVQREIDEEDVALRSLDWQRWQNQVRSKNRDNAVANFAAATLEPMAQSQTARMGVETVQGMFNMPGGNFMSGFVGGTMFDEVIKQQQTTNQLLRELKDKEPRPPIVVDHISQ